MSRHNINILESFQNLFRPDTNQILTRQLELWSGLESRLKNPDDFLTEKNKDLTIFDTMMLDDRISSIIELKKKIVLSVEGNIMPASDLPADKERAEFIEKMIYSMSMRWWDILDNFLDAMIYGFKVAEKIWQIKDGKWIIANIKHKHSIFFDFDYDEYGNFDKLYIGHYYGQEKVITGREAIDQKFMLFVYPYPKDGNWYGQSDLTACYPLYWQKYNIQRWRGVYLQNFGMPMPVVNYDKDKTSSAEKNELKELLDNLQESLYVLIPSIRDQKSGELVGKFKFEFKESASGQGNAAYQDAIDQLDKAIARKLLIPDKIGFSESQTGSYSLGQIHFDILTDIIQELHGKLEDLINNMIRQVEDLNFPGVDGNYSEWKFRSLTQRVEKDMLDTLIKNGIIDPREKWIRAWTGVPEITIAEQEEIDDVKKEALARQQQIMSQQIKQKEKENVDNQDKDNFKNKNNISFITIDGVHIPIGTEKNIKQSKVNALGKSIGMNPGEYKTTDGINSLSRWNNIYDAKAIKKIDQDVNEGKSIDEIKSKYKDYEIKSYVNFSNHIEKQPTYHGPIKRAFRDEDNLFDNIKTGENFEIKQYSSASKINGEYNIQGHNLTFYIKNNTRAKIFKYAKYKEEQEVIIPKGKYKVINKKNNTYAARPNEIYLEEI